MENKNSEEEKLRELIRIQKQIEENLKYLESNYENLTNAQIQKLTNLMRSAEDTLSGENDPDDTEINLDDIDFDKI